jgi:hypothetical protein
MLAMKMVNNHLVFILHTGSCNSGMWLYTRVQLLAAFIYVWLCSYCVPIEQGAFIRPEVFMAPAAASVSQGICRSFKVVRMAHLYSSFDNISRFIKENTNSASECELPLAMHFIMDWYSCYWTALSSDPTSSLLLQIRLLLLSTCGKLQRLKSTWRKHIGFSWTLTEMVP